MSAVHGLVSRIPVNLPLESFLVSYQQVYEKFPTYSVEKEAVLDLAEQKEERERGNDAGGSGGGWEEGQGQD